MLALKVMFVNERNDMVNIFMYLVFFFTPVEYFDFKL